MTEAIAEARLAAEAGEVPVGAVIVRNDEIIGRGRNRKEEKKSPIYHAEIEAIEAACAFIGDWRLTGGTLYVTAEPCVMCAGAIIHARLARVVFGVKEPKFGGVVTHACILDSVAFNHRTEWLSGICKDEISVLMKDFFVKLRA